jgi:hypothetical protein
MDVSALNRALVDLGLQSSWRSCAWGIEDFERIHRRQDSPALPRLSPHLLNYNISAHRHEHRQGPEKANPRQLSKTGFNDRVSTQQGDAQVGQCEMRQLIHHVSF